jgi:uncharacterized protein YqeY
MNFMSIKNQLEQALKESLRAGDEARKRTLRMVLAAIRNAEVERRGSLDEAATLALIQKEIKTRRETIADAQRAQRPELVAEAEAEIAILESFLPKSLTIEELEQMARQAIAEAGATSIKEMGQVMKILMPRVQGRAEGSQVSQIVRRLLE